MERKTIHPVLSIDLYNSEVQESRELLGAKFFYVENNLLMYGPKEVFRLNDGSNIMHVIYQEDRPLTRKVVELYLDEYIQLNKYQLDLGTNSIKFDGGGYWMNEIQFEEVDYDLDWIDIILDGLPEDSLVTWQQMNGSHPDPERSRVRYLTDIFYFELGEGIIEIETGLLELLDIMNDLVEYYDDIKEVTEYGDIADYISTKTLVELPDGLEGNKPVTWQQLGGITFDNLKKNVKYNSDTLYFDDGGEELADRLIHTDYLLEIILNYKQDIHGSKSINWRQVNGSQEYQDREFNPVLAPISGAPSDMKFDDGLGMITKLNFIESETVIENGEEVIKETKHPMTWNGFHITSGNLAEYTFVIRAHAIPGIIQLKNLFVLEISEDSIIVYPINGDIQEYFIVSCKIISKPRLLEYQ